MKSLFVGLCCSVSLLMLSDRLAAAESEGSPLPPAEAARTLVLPDGFRATLFAGEPDVVQPIAMTFDDRGRLWVVECLSYPDWSRDGGGRDRVLIFEDADGDGRFDRRKVFLEQGLNLTGIEIGYGGVWLSGLPNLLFVPDRDQNDVPDGPGEVHLNGWSLEVKHNAVNGLTWGPDGWLYGCHGILADSFVGPPGASAAERVRLNCGVWRYHPTRRTFEVVCHGTTNPWGLDFDAYGQMFITNCVIPHLFHVVPGAHYQRMFGLDLDPHAYSLMESCADHLHWAGGWWKTSLGGKHGEAGGGHAHSGAMIYQGDNWPEEYRGDVLMINIHGQRLNRDHLELQGSGYVAHHGPDMMFSKDPWFRGVAVKYGPDGGVYVADWNDGGECHDYDTIERHTGRIFKITYGQPEHRPVKIAAASDEELIGLLGHDNQWHVRQARHALAQRAAAGTLDPQTASTLREVLKHAKVTAPRLEALWTLYTIGAADDALLTELLGHRDEHVRGWAVRLVLDDRQATPAQKERLAGLADRESSPRVRLELAAALQRLPVGERWPLAAGLVSRAEDARDANLPLMIWYGLKALPSEDLERSVELLARARLPLVREYLSRRIAMEGPEGWERLAALLGKGEEQPILADVVRGMYEALKGRKGLPAPASWSAAFSRLRSQMSPEGVDQAIALALIFGDPEARQRLTRTVMDSSAPEADRRRALEMLIEAPPEGFAPSLQQLLETPELRALALRGLARYANPETPAAILKHYPRLSPGEKEEALATLAAREPYVEALLEAIEDGRIPPADLPAYTARQIAGYQNPQFTDRLRRVWGELRSRSTDKIEAIAKYRDVLQPQALEAADRLAGRAVFDRTCAGCHRLFDAGESIGPDLTGSQRTSLDYLLENLVDPSALVPMEYQVTTIVTTDGRLISGIVAEENDRVVVLQTATERVIVDKTDIEQQQKENTSSMMPEGLIERLSPEELQNLVAYLMSPAQVPRPGE